MWALKFKDNEPLLLVLAAGGEGSKTVDSGEVVLVSSPYRSKLDLPNDETLFWHCFHVLAGPCLVHVDFFDKRLDDE